jgi:hypothetical protein
MTGLCTICGEESPIRKVDNGIGVTEAWGVRSRHTDYAVETTCCNAPALGQNGEEITLRDLMEDDYDDYREE